MWYVRDVLYAVLYVRVSCFIVRRCAVSARWSSIASSTSINKLQVMQNAALRTATGCTYYICMTKHSYFPYTSAYTSTRHNTNKTQHPSHPLHKHTTYFNTPRLKNTIFNNGRFTTNIHTDPYIIYTTDINKHAPYTYIYCL